MLHGSCDSVGCCRAQDACGSGTDASLVCQKEYGRCDDSLRSAKLHQDSTVVKPPTEAASWPSGLYASVLSAGIAAGASFVEDSTPQILGRAAVTGLWLWASTDATPCEDLVRENATLIREDLNQAQLEFPSVNTSELIPLLPSMICDLNLTGYDLPPRALQVPPWFPATHYHVQLYLLQADADDAPPSEGARRLLQERKGVGSSPAEVALQMIFDTQEARKFAQEAMSKAASHLVQFTNISASPIPASLLPIEFNLNTDEKGLPWWMWSILALSAVVLILLLACTACCLLRRRTPPPSPRTYVESAEGLAQPMLHAERREQLKGLLKWLKRKRTEEMIHARTRPLGEPVELGPEPAARTKVEYIVKSLLCASAPGPGVAVELSCAFSLDKDCSCERRSRESQSQAVTMCCRLDAQPVHRTVLTTPIAGVAYQAEPQFQADVPTLLQRLVLKGSDACKPAAARLSSANDLLFDGDPFGIYRTVQFQTNMWEMLLSYREVGQHHVQVARSFSTLSGSCMCH